MLVPDFMPYVPIRDMAANGLFPINITENSFQLSKTSDGQPIVLINKESVDVAKFRFEIVSHKNIIIDKLNCKSLTVEIIGQFARNPRYVGINKAFAAVGYMGNDGVNTRYYYAYHDAEYSLGGIYRINVSLGGGIYTTLRDWYILNFSPTSTTHLSVRTGNWGGICYTDDTVINAFNITNGFLMLNGCSLKLYKK